MNSHLGLESWPFQVVPDARSARTWADRAKVKEDLELLVRRLARSEASSIHLLWAYFGAGKTHFLRHLAYIADDQPNVAMITTYSVFPRTVRGFIDLYRVMAKNWSAEQVANAYSRMESEEPSLADSLDVEFLTGCRALVVRPDTSATVLDWLRGGRPLAPALRAAGLTQRIDTSERAIEVAASLCRLFRWSTDGRMVWMIDEFQRIGQLRPAQRNDVNIGLHSLFNELPTGFSLILSFSFGESRNIQFLLSEELLDRANMEKYFKLPPLTEDEARVFVLDLLAAHRGGAQVENEAFPFSDTTIRDLISRIAGSGRLGLKPRTLMQVFNAVLEEADPRLEDGSMDYVSPDFARAVFEERVADSLSLDGEEDET